MPASMTGRTLSTEVFVNSFDATLPLLHIGNTVSMKGLNGFGTAGQTIKVNSAGNALEYADDTDTQYTSTSPLLLTGTTFSLNGLSGFGTAGQVIKVNSAGTALEYANDNNTTCSVLVTRFLQKGMS